MTPKTCRNEAHCSNEVNRNPAPPPMAHICTLSAIFFVVCHVSTLFAQQEKPLFTTPPLAANRLNRGAILQNISTNSDKRCLGISAVAEALLDGVLLEGSEKPEKIAERIYHNLTTGMQLRFTRNITDKGNLYTIDSKYSIDKLSTLVAQHFKHDYERLVKTESGSQKLIAAQSSFVGTKTALERILDADPDKTVVFCGSGTRLFPNGTAKETYHAFLISKQSDSEMVVYDANDPGSAIKCEIKATDEGVTIKWTCQYRDTKQRTTQSYLVVPAREYFRIMLGE